MAIHQRHEEPAVIVALVMLVAIAAHAAALRSGFIWLDHAHIEDGIALAPFRAWPTLFQQGFAGTGYYRPLMALSLSLDAALTHASWLFHASSVMWHAAAAALTSVAALSLGLSRRAALGAGLLFAVHPLSSLVAGTIAFRSEAMIATALLTLVVLHRQGHPLAALALLFGALTKETALILGPMFVVDLELDAPSPRPPFLRRARLWLWEAAALGAAVGLRLRFAPHWRATFAPLAPSDALGTRLAALGKSATRVLAPVDNTVCDTFPVTSLLSFASLIGLAVTAGLAYLAYKRRGPALLLLIAILPSLQLVPVMRWWSPHYVYIALAFAAMLIAEYACTRSTAVQRVAAFGLAMLGALTLITDLRFESDATLWGEEVSADPTCREGHFYLAEVARMEGRWDDAASSYERALETSSNVLGYVDRVPALQNLGAVRLEQGRFADAGVAFRTAIDAVPDEGHRRLLLHNLATAELRAGNAEEAARLLEVEVARSDALEASIFVRARAVESLGRAEEARALFRRLQTRVAPRR
jgi:tetratricopeptide (TPR) repeat protein